jgi:hypothetical protein
MATAEGREETMKSKNSNSLCMAVLIGLLFGTEPAQAWNSLWYYTHGKITDDAINSISQADYPDIYRFAGELRTGSQSEDSHNPPGDDYDFKVWAPIDTLWWDKFDVHEGTVTKKGARF